MAGIKIPISYEYNVESLNQLKNQFNSIVKDAELGPAFDAELKAINNKFASIGEEMKKQLASGKIDVEALGLTDLEKMIEKFAKGMAFVLNEALDDTEIEKYTKKVTALGDEIIAKQKEIKALQKQRKDLEDDKGSFKAKFGLARMPTLDPLEAERRLAAAQQELAASGGGAANEDLEKRIKMFKELIALLNKEQSARTGFYTAELNKAKAAAKEAKDELFDMITSGFASPGDKNYRPNTYNRQETISKSREEVQNLFAAMDSGNETEAAGLYNKMVVDVEKLAALEEKRNKLIAERTDLENKSKEGYQDLLKIANDGLEARKRSRKVIDALTPSKDKLQGLKAEYMGGAKDIAMTGIQGPSSDFRFKFKQQIEGLNNEIPVSLKEARESYKEADALLQQAIESGNTELQASLKKRLEDLQKFRNTYKGALKALGYDPESMASTNIEYSLGTGLRYAQGRYDKSLAKEQDAANQMGEKRELSRQAFEKTVEIQNIDAEVQALKEKRDALEQIKQVEADIAAQKLAAREEFQSKFGMQGMPTEDLDQAKNMLAGAQKELAQGAAGGDPALQNKVALYRELVELLQREKQTKEEIDSKISTAQADITELNTKKKEAEVKLEQQKLKLGEESKNQSRQVLEINTALNTLKAAGIELTKEEIDEIEKLVKQQKSSNDEGDREKKGLIARAGATFSYGLIIGQLRRVYQQTIRTVRELDKAMTEAAIVTEMNRQEAYKLLGAYQQLARETGLATSEISGIVVEFLKQGRTMKEAMELAGVAAKAAKVAGIDAREAVDYLTSAVNGFNLAATEAESIADKFSAISAASATDFEELAIAMSKVAPSAKTAGVGVDFMMGVLAKGLEVTREAPENIGTAFKTIFARMREVTDLGKATEDGMSLNRVEKALQSIGVPLRDVTGQFRNLETVLIEVGDKWNTLTSIEQAYIATALAGTRQQPRLLAIFNDFARTKELIEISTEATGQLSFQHMEYMQGAEAALAQLKTAWEGFIMAFTDADIIVDTIRLITDLINGLTSAFDFLGGSTNKNIIAIGVVSVALAGLAVKTAKANMEKMKQITLDRNISLLTNKQKNDLVALNKVLEKGTEVEKEKARAQIDSIKGMKNGKLTIDSYKKAILANVQAMALQLLVSLAVAAAFALVTAAIAGVAYLIKEANKPLSDFTNSMMENNKKLDDLGKKEKEVTKLVDAFEKLNRKVVKSTEDLEEMKRIATELEEVEIGGRSYSLMRTDITGNQILDKNAYEAFLKQIENERLELLEKNMQTFTSALARFGAAAFDDYVITSYARNIGTDFGITFLNSMKESFSEGAVSDAMSKFRSAMQNVSPDIFTKISFKPITSMNTEERQQYDFIKSMVTDAKDYETMIERITQATAEAAEKFNWSAEKERETLETRIAILGNITTAVFDEDMASNFAEKIGLVLLNAAQAAEKVTGSTADILDARLDSYLKAIQDIQNDTSLSDQEVTVTLKFLEASMQDEAIMNALINERGLSLDFIVNIVEAGTPIQEVNDLIETFGADLRELDAMASEDTIQNLMTDYAEILSTLFEGDYQTGYNKLYQLLNVFADAGDIASGINAVTNALGLLNATSAATQLTESGKLVSDLMKLPEQIAKGDFSKYTDLVAEFGFDAVNAVLQGSSPAIEEFLQGEKDKFQTEVLAAINAIEAANRSLNRGVLDLSDAEQDQVDQLRLMLQYYDQIAGMDQLRIAVLKEVKDLVKETTDLYSLQQKFSNLGMSEDNLFMQMLDKVINITETGALEKLNEQLDADIAALQEFGNYDTETGIFTPSADMTFEAKTALEKMLETATQLIDIQTAAYNREKKVIEDRYKEEIDALKTANDEKWKAIEYSDKLRESEEKILLARRTLMGLQLSGVTSGMLGDAQKDLQKLQQERQRMIEAQMVAEAEKALQKQRDLAVQQLGEQQLQATNALTQAMIELTEVITGGGIGNTGTATPTITLAGDTIGTI